MWVSLSFPLFFGSDCVSPAGVSDVRDASLSGGCVEAHEPACPLWQQLTRGATSVAFCLLVSNPGSVRELCKSMETPCSSHDFPPGLISADGSRLIKAAKC